MKKIVAGTSALALSLSMTSVAFAATDNQAINLNVEVVDTLSMDCWDLAGIAGDTSVALGTDTNPGAGMVTAGVPAVGSSRCEVITNDDQGYYLTIDNTSSQAGGTGSVLSHVDPNTGDVYNIADKTTAIATPEAWAGTGLGFSVIAFPDGTPANNTLGGIWGNPATPCLAGDNVGTDDADYAGIPTSAEAIAAVPEYNAGTTTTDVCYKVDVPSTQQSGLYSGQVTFTATSDASAYLN